MSLNEVSQVSTKKVRGIFLIFCMMLQWHKNLDLTFIAILRKSFFLSLRVKRSPK